MVQPAVYIDGQPLTADPPEHDPSLCAGCLMCWVYCPEDAIVVEHGKVVLIDPQYCNGCGTCVNVCPPKRRAMHWPHA